MWFMFGRPLSSLFYYVVVEVVRAIIHKSVQLGSYKGIQIPGVDNMITCVQFADDTLLFINDDIGSLKAAKIYIKMLPTSFKIKD